MNKMIKSALILVAGFAFVANISANTLTLKIKNDSNEAIQFNTYTNNTENIDESTQIDSKKQGVYKIDWKLAGITKELKVLRLSTFISINGGKGYGFGKTIASISLIKGTTTEGKTKEIGVLKVNVPNVGDKYFADITSNSKWSFKDKYDQPQPLNIKDKINPASNVLITIHEDLSITIK